MKKYSIRVLYRKPDRVFSRVTAFKAFSVTDALVKFERYGLGELTPNDYEIEAVWQCSSCECRARTKGSAK